MIIKFLKSLKRQFRRFKGFGDFPSGHYYSPVPNLKEIDTQIFKSISELPGINLTPESQIKFLENVVSKYKAEFDCFGINEPQDDSGYFSLNGSFGEVDGDVLYSIIRHYRPENVIEIGSGFSTLLSVHALEKNKTLYNVPYKLIAIEPYPPDFLKNKLGLKIELLPKKVQEVDICLFSILKENDILFIDSTHVAKAGSDVCYEILEILPRLNKGVFVHIHDIFMPLEYPETWVMKNKIFWNEQYILQAFLAFNDSFEIIWAGNYCKIKVPEKYRSMFRCEGGQSFWIRKI